jgi:hypothetical protein
MTETAVVPDSLPSDSSLAAAALERAAAVGYEGFVCGLKFSVIK